MSGRNLNVPIVDIRSNVLHSSKIITCEYKDLDHYFQKTHLHVQPSYPGSFKGSIQDGGHTGESVFDSRAILGTRMGDDRTAFSRVSRNRRCRFKLYYSSF